MWTRQPLVLSILILIWDNMFLKHLWRKSKEAIKYVYSISHILKPCNKYSVKESYTPHKYATRLVTFGITNISTLTYADKIMLLRKKVIYLTVPNHQWDIPVFFQGSNSITGWNHYDNTENFKYSPVSHKGNINLYLRSYVCKLSLNEEGDKTIKHVLPVILSQ